MLGDMPRRRCECQWWPAPQPAPAGWVVDLQPGEHVGIGNLATQALAVRMHTLTAAALSPSSDDAACPLRARSGHASTCCDEHVWTSHLS